MAWGGADAMEAGEEVDRREGAAELAVGRLLQAGVFLHPHRLADAVVLDLLELGGFFCAGLLQRSRAQEAADMVGAKGRAHGESLQWESPQRSWNKRDSKVFAKNKEATP